MSANFDLSPKDLQILKEILAQFSEVKEVVVYGSRAKGTNNERSDIDLVIKNSEIDRHTLGMIKYEVDNSDIPYLVDLQDYRNINNSNLLKQIDNSGVVFYKSM